MDKITKALQKLTEKEQKQIKIILEKLLRGNLSGLDIKRFKGQEYIFRIRTGDIRIIYRKDSKDKIFILVTARRNEKTYKF